MTAAARRRGYAACESLPWILGDISVTEVNLKLLRGAQKQSSLASLTLKLGSPGKAQPESREQNLPGCDRVLAGEHRQVSGPKREGGARQQASSNKAESPKAYIDLKP